MQIEAKKKFQFNVSSDEMELLVALEEHQSLTELANHLHRDKSSISRALQALPNEFVEKHDGKWRLSDKGKTLSCWARTAISAQDEILKRNFENTRSIRLDQSVALIVIGMQKAVFGEKIPGRSFGAAIHQISRMIKYWRDSKWPVVHIHYVGNSNFSSYSSHLVGHEPLYLASDGEVEIEASSTNTYLNTGLEATLNSMGIRSLVCVGSSLNQCVLETAIQGMHRGFFSLIVADAVITDPIRNSLGEYQADQAESVLLANFNEFYGDTVKVADLLGFSESVKRL